MKFNFFFLSLLLISGNFLFAQTFQVTYIQTVIGDSTQSIENNPQNTNSSIWTLVGSNDYSFYYSKGRNYSSFNARTIDSLLSTKKDSIINQNKYGVEQNNSNLVTVSLNSSAYLTEDTAAKYVYIDKRSNKVLTRDIFGKTYLLTEEEIPIINWEITDKKKRILSYDAFLARAYYRGRSYTAWFTNAIPILSGPWKFGGLPGIILELYSDDNQVKFIASEVKMPANAEIPEKPITSGTKLSLSDYFSYPQNTYHEMGIKNKAVTDNIESSPAYQANPGRFDAVIKMQKKSEELNKKFEKVFFFIEKRF